MPEKGDFCYHGTDWKQKVRLFRDRHKMTRSALVIFQFIGDILRYEEHYEHNFYQSDFRTHYSAGRLYGRRKRDRQVHESLWDY